MTVAYQHILYETEGPVATITMNRPDQLNALTGLMQAEIRHALDQSERNPEVIGTVPGAVGDFAERMIRDMSDARADRVQ